MLNFTLITIYCDIFSWYLALLFALEATEGVEQKKIHLQRLLASQGELTREAKEDAERERG